MQNLYMMAALVREQQMQKMAIEITQQLLSVEQAMIKYNVSTEEGVINCVENLKSKNERPTAKNQRGYINLKAQAA